MDRSPAPRLGTLPGLSDGAIRRDDAAAGCSPTVPRGRRVLWAPRDLPDLEADVAGDLPRYREWARCREAERLAAAQRTAAADGGPGPATTGAASGPEIALLVVVDRPDPAWLRRCLRSVAGQTAAHWRLSVAVTGSVDPAVDAVLGEALGSLPAGRVDLHHCPEGTAEPQAVVAMLAASTSPAFALLGQHDQLAPDAVALLAAALVDADLAYADEDRVDEEGLALDPVLKPDWSPELCLSYPYVGRPVAMRRAPVAASGGVRAVDAGDWEHDLVLRVTEHTDRVAHVAEVLCHRGNGGGPPGAGGRAGGGGAVVAALARRGEDATVDPGPLPGTWYVRRRLAERPTVSAIIPFRDAATLLRACVDSVTATAAGTDLELVLVDNGSEEPETLTLLDRLDGRAGVTIRRDPRPFNWAALNNAAVGAARGEVLLFLNNDIEALRPGWLAALAAQALRPEVGAVGARLLYPTGRVQHAGVVLGLAGAAGHVLAGLPGDRPGYLGMAVLTRDCSAVTGACLATRRTVFERLDGFDETLGLDVNDIDYCLRSREQGLHVVYEPQAELVHHESPSRGTSGSAQDQLRFLDRWQDMVVAGDPYLSRHLTRVDCSAALRGADEERWWYQWRSTLTRS